MGAHDENMTMAEVEALVGKPLAAKLKEVSLKLYQRCATTPAPCPGLA